MIASDGDTLQLDAPLALGPRGRAQAEVSDNLDAIQRAHIESVLERCGWRINGAGNSAERLGIHPNTLRFRMKKLGVVCPDSRGRRSDIVVRRTVGLSRRSRPAGFPRGLSLTFVRGRVRFLGRDRLSWLASCPDGESSLSWM